jgi:hypothetical protein
MQPQVVFGRWLEVDGDGTTFISADLCGTFGLKVGEQVNLWEADQGRAGETLLLRPYLESNRVRSIRLVEGYGARLSAPGYLDCTDWCVFATREEAEASLREIGD